MAAAIMWESFAGKEILWGIWFSPSEPLDAYLESFILVLVFSKKVSFLYCYNFLEEFGFHPMKRWMPSILLIGAYPRAAA